MASNPVLGPTGRPHPNRSVAERVKHPFPQLREQLKETHLNDVKAELSHLKNTLGKLRNIVNPNHRHDEPHEQRTDEKRSAIAREHRFESYAPERGGNCAKWYVDGRDYFWVRELWVSPATFPCLC